MVILSDLHDPDAVGAIKLAGQRHDCMVIQLRDPAERGGLKAGFVRGAEAETGTQFVSSGRTRFDKDRLDHAAEQFAGAGLDYLLLETDRPFLLPLRHFLANRSPLGRRIS
ncbi:MAG: hypothetical protein GY826_02885 [Fuerstiella sp.]|nr:hypothetical protein [Fuerstiella sp.]